MEADEVEAAARVEKRGRCEEAGEVLAATAPACLCPVGWDAAWAYRRGVGMGPGRTASVRGRSKKER